MSDRPIIFSAPMVRALLDGRKTMTRRYAWRIEKGDDAECFPTIWQRVKPGDRLWVRESFARPKGGSIFYRTDSFAAGLTWHPSIHMRRDYSRLTLIVTATRIEWLWSISENDCLAEGIPPITLEGAWTKPLPEKPNTRAIYGGAFCKLWNDLHGPGSWDANPEVVALTFTVHKGNIDRSAP